MLVLAAPGCGDEADDGEAGPEDSAEEVQSLLLEYDHAVEAGRWDDACRLYTDELRREIIGEDDRPCARVVGEAYGMGHLPSVDVDLLRQLQNNQAEVRLDGADSAKVATERGEEGEWVLIRRGESWRLADLPPSPT